MLLILSLPLSILVCLLLRRLCVTVHIPLSLAASNSIIILPHYIHISPSVSLFFSTWIAPILTLHLLLIPQLPIMSPLVLLIIPPTFYLAFVVFDIAIAHLSPTSPKTIPDPPVLPV